MLWAAMNGWCEKTCTTDGELASMYEFLFYQILTSSKSLIDLVLLIIMLNVLVFGKKDNSLGMKCKGVLLCIVILMQMNSKEILTMLKSDYMHTGHLLPWFLEQDKLADFRENTQSFSISVNPIWVQVSLSNSRRNYKKDTSPLL